MASKRKRTLPLWLQGVTVKKKGAASDTSSSSIDQGSEEVSVTNGRTPEVVGNQFAKSEADQQSAKCDLDQVVVMSYEEYIFNGSIIYSHDSGDCNIICEDIISHIGAADTYVGFDTEWPVTYEKGAQAKTALVQVCTDVNKCYLFHVSCMPKFPVMLRKLIQMKSVKKIGLNVENDIWKLGIDFDIQAKEVVQSSAIELRTLANKKLKSAENWSLEGLAKNVLHCRISKDPNIRKCDWRQFPLPEVQQRYAATDAAVSLLIYQKLTKDKR